MLGAAVCEALVFVTLSLAAPNAPDPDDAARRPYEGPTAVPSLDPASVEPARALAMAPQERESQPPARRPVEESPAVQPPTVVPTTAPLAEPAPTFSPALVYDPDTNLRIRPILDTAIILGTAAPSFALALWVEPSLPENLPMPGTEPNVGSFDAIALGRFEEAPAIASDVLLAVSFAAPLVYHAVEAGVRRRGISKVRGRGFLPRYMTDLVLIAQAIAVNGLITEILKASLQRPRPYTYLTCDDVAPDQCQELMDKQVSYNADWSFPSGHTSAALAVSTAGATILTLELLGRSKWGIAAVWIGSLGLGTATAVTRVAAGRHFPSDVLTSALLGSAVGITVPLAHWRPEPSRARARGRTKGPAWTLGPMPTLGGGGGLALSGTLP